MTTLPDAETETPGETGATLVFRAEDVSKSFGSTGVLKGITFDVFEGERVAVIGPSGAGKTTLFRLLCGVLHPTDGRITAFGEDTSQLWGRKLRRLRRSIGILYQNDNLIPHLRVVHNVLMGRLGSWHFPRALLSLFWPQQLDRAKEALTEVELLSKLWSMPGELSGGQQQRVAIARLMVQEPRVMLADEPVSQLDIRLGREIIELLTGLASRLGNTLLVNLHTLELLHGHFDRVIALREGEIFWQGTPSEINRDLLEELYGAEYRAMHLDEVELKS